MAAAPDRDRVLHSDQQGGADVNRLDLVGEQSRHDEPIVVYVHQSVVEKRGTDIRLLLRYFPGMIGLSTIIPTRSNKANNMKKPNKRTRIMSPIFFNAMFSITYSDKAEF